MVKMDNGFVEITAQKYDDGVQVLVNRKSPERQSMVFTLTVGEIEELCDILKEETYR